MSPEWRYAPAASERAENHGVKAWWFPDAPDVKKRYEGYVIELFEREWWISPDSWSFVQDRVGPFDTPEDALAALDTMLFLNEPPKRRRPE